MRCRFFSDAGGFLDVAGRFLAEYEAENTVLVGRALRCVRRPRSIAVMAVVQDDGAVRLAALMSPPHALVLSTGHADAIPCLVEGFRTAAIRLPGVASLERIPERFAAAWTSRVPAVARAESWVNLYRAASIRVPSDVLGELRAASDDDLESLAA
jgi:hypothetical protein